MIGYNCIKGPLGLVLKIDPLQRRSIPSNRMGRNGLSDLWAPWLMGSLTYGLPDVWTPWGGLVSLSKDCSPKTLPTCVLSWETIRAAKTLALLTTVTQWIGSDELPSVPWCVPDIKLGVFCSKSFAESCSSHRTDSWANREKKFYIPFRISDSDFGYWFTEFRWKGENLNETTKLTSNEVSVQNITMTGNIKNLIM